MTSPSLCSLCQTCGRFGPHQPLAFANTERHPFVQVLMPKSREFRCISADLSRLSVQVHFPCTPAAALFIFWNAEYVPGPFAFAVTDR